MKTWKESFDFFFKSGMQVQLGGPLINLLFLLSYLVKYRNVPIRSALPNRSAPQGSLYIVTE